MKGLYHTGETDLKDIFSAPLDAVIDADVKLSKKITEFIAHYGFEKGRIEPDERGNENYGRLRMVSFTYINSKGQKEVFSIPILSLIPLPLLRIKDADFDMNVQLVLVDEPNRKVLPSLTDEPETVNVQKKIKGYIPASVGGAGMTQNMEAHMKVKLRMGEADIPGGLIKILAFMNNMDQEKIEKHE